MPNQNYEPNNNLVDHSARLAAGQAEIARLQAEQANTLTSSWQVAEAAIVARRAETRAAITEKCYYQPSLAGRLVNKVLRRS